MYFRESFYVDSTNKTTRKHFDCYLSDFTKKKNNER